MIAERIRWASLPHARQSATSARSSPAAPLKRKAWRSPCSMKTLAGICHGYAENLLLRAADVTLKERRKLVLVAREAPLGLVHLRNMTALAEMGVTILPPMLTYYQHPNP